MSRNERKKRYLRETAMLAVTAFGGPQSHLGIITDRFVNKSGLLTTEELLELNAFCQMLPGPSSTQVITAIGFRLGGPGLAFLGLLLWVLPAAILMTLIALGITFFGRKQIDLRFLRYIQPMAIGFIGVAGVQFARMVGKDWLSWVLMLATVLVVTFFGSPFVYPVVILAGGFISSLYNKEPIASEARLRNRPIRFDNLILFFSILIIAAVSGFVLKRTIGPELARPVLLFENTYRFGSLVFGGGNVLFPMMYEQFVDYKHYLSPKDFALGLGLSQALPGPVFAISTYANALAMSSFGPGGQILGAIIGTVAIFLPGTLLLFFFFPLWAQVKRHPVYKKADQGFKATAAGLVLAAAFILLQHTERSWDNFAVMAVTMLLVSTRKTPSPLIVLLVIIAGFLR